MSGTATRSDSTLLISVGRRDQQALAELYQRHGGSVFSVALRVVTVRGLAEEVVQDVFTRLWQSPERVDPARGSLRSFLLAQGHNRAVDIVRSESSRRRREETDANEVSGTYVLEDDAMEAAMGQEVRKVVATLPKPERDAIGLAYFGGHSYQEVASLLSVPEGTAKSRIRSGLARLRAALVEAGIDPFVANKSVGVRSLVVE